MLNKLTFKDANLTVDWIGFKFQHEFKFLKKFLCRNDVKIVIIWTVTGGILQVLSKQYLKSYPEFLKDVPVTNVTEEKYRPLRFLFPRGGSIIEISGISIKIVAQVKSNFVAKKRLLAGLATW